MSQSQFQEHMSENWFAYIIIGVIALAIIGVAYLEELNDQEYFKTLDKLTCEEVWQLMLAGTPDWDTTNYYGDRC